MDSGPAHNVGNSHLQAGGNNETFGVDFMGGIHNYTAAADSDMQQFFDNELFEGQDYNGLQSQPQEQQTQQSPQSNYPAPAYNQNAQRTQSPAMPNYGQPPQYTQHPQYQQQIYDQRNMYRPPFDPALFQQRPSHSPSPLDHHYQYPGQAFSNQGNPGQVNIQPRPTPSPAPQYPPARQQTYSPYMTFDSRGPTLPQHQDADLLQFASFQTQNQNQPPSHAFVNPSLLGAEANNLNGNYGQIPHRQAQPYYGNMTIQQHMRQQQMPAMSQTLQPNQMQVGMPQLIQPANVKKASRDPNAPQRPRGRPRKDGSIPSNDGGTGSASSSDLEFEDAESEPEITPALITVSPPTDERVRAVFNAVKAVWSPRNKPAPVDKIKAGVMEFGDTIRTLRDAWKARNDNLKKAELEGSTTASAAPALKAEVAQYRQTAETLVTKTLLLAHPVIMRSLGENLYTLSAMYSFMLDRVTAVDYESSLLLAMLKLGENFATLDDEKLESSKWSKALQRLSKKASGQTKTLAQTIIDNAKSLTAHNKKTAENKGNGDAAAGLKRAREGDVVGPATKRIVKPSSKPLALQNAEKRRAQEAAEAAKKAKAGAGSSGTLITPAAAKPKAPLSAPKSTAFASLMSASKKPGTSNAERAAFPKKDAVVQQVKREPSRRDSPPASSIPTPAPAKGSSFLSGLFVEEKKEVKPKKEEDVLIETPEQKAKRVRKESRRKLRVSWKSDKDLVETRFFTHDPDEEINRGDSAMKDAGDSGKEGEMLKRSMAMEDEDDEEEDGDFDPDCYTEPSIVDFSGLASEDCDPDLNGTKHGGTLKAESKSAEAQDKLEETSIMAIYATASDRPDTPKEPPDEGDDDFNPSDDFGEPEDKVRTREKELYTRSRSQGFGTDGHADFASSLQAMNSNSAPQYSAPTAQANAGDLLARLTAMGMIQPQQAQPTPATAPTFDLASIVASVSSQGNAQSYQPYQQQAGPDQTNALQAIMARIQQGQGSTPPNYSQIGAEEPDGKKGKKGKKTVPLDENGRPLNYKTKVCEFWEKGNCLYGDDCTFRHSK